ncbi:MAG TPA: glycosyltransferase family 4 protein [Methylomirabilota bacterium]|nr:glycosyltransferase family 4 protein [Methylomirabilota bacterium]
MQLARLLREHGLTVRILNINRHATSGQEYESSGSRLGLLWKLVTLADRGSILHLHTNGHSRKSWLMILMASLAGRIRGVTAVLTLHSGVLPGYVAGFGTGRRRLARWVLRPFTRVICVNPEICGSVQRLGIAGSQTAVIPAFLGVPDTPERSTADRALVREFRPLLVAVAGGEEDPERGLSVVLRAVQQLVPLYPGLGAILMGWQVGPKTRPLIAELGLAGRAVCLGEVSHDRCLALLRASDVAVRSTFVDGDAITVREALAFGVPVVASDTGYRPEGVTLFRRGDVSDLTAKVRQVLARPTVGKSRARPGDERAARAIWQLYTELMGPEDATTGLVQPPPRPEASS